MTDRISEYMNDYKSMLIIRRFEEKILALFDAGKLKGTTHVCIGQEAVSVGVCSVLEKTDWITSTHRGHGHCIAKGGNINRLMAEIYGKKSGYCGGRGGSQHIFDFDIGFLGANGITGGGLPLALGAAFTAAYRRDGSIAVAFIGDGAVNQGYFHETLNMAAIWNLPLITVCENNHYAMSTPATKTSPTKSIAERAVAYNMPGSRIDGNDVYEVRSAMLKAVERARKGDGPSFIEAVTYRFCGHSKSDKCLYRDKEEEKKWMERCPIALQTKRLFENGVSREDISRIDEEVGLLIKRAVEFAENDAIPDHKYLEESLYEISSPVPPEENS